MNSPHYTHPVSQLLTYGELEMYDFQKSSHYLEKFGLTEEQIPELIRMVGDYELHDADPESLEVWGPIHAWRSLAELRSETAIQPLLSVIHELLDHDWFRDELPHVLAQIGPAAIPALRDYLANPDYDASARSSAVDSLEVMASQHPEFRDECVSILTERLAYSDPESQVLNSFIVYSLVELKAVEAASAIEAAFAGDRINKDWCEDWDTVQVELGLKKPKKKLKNPSGIAALFEKHHEKPSKPQVSSGFGSTVTPQKAGNKKKKKRK
ncbi:HEAT repeat domain-containing protein [Phormidium pseudopriestleyi FRX01]|uniref:HEAT repeat domain-containing protein n=1 Tax=Phormidium pseudopriestleyi FRX01 TaxID=1759528 RepID=A0ABS3FWI2_9CYAN|nr:HEAT repeat domain-containing protein [Phormidium pseudopriestleyi]MBO0351128.1 HEAT repeat domain-containing protein [Phormidium pseudopriestleyi FRX01]